MLSIKILLILITLNIRNSLSETATSDPGGEFNDEEFKNPNFYPNHIGIVQMFQWPFDYIARECEEYLGPQGFGGVQTSPIFENHIEEGRPWYELYQPISYKIKTRLGDETQFRDMIRRCNKVGVRVYVDTILNHMARPGKGILRGAAGSLAIPQLLHYPAVPYTILDFHPRCLIKNFEDRKQIRKCRLLNLPDLNQSKSRVQKIQIEMLNRLISMGVAGFRVDASSFMEPTDLKEIFSKLKYLPTEFNFANHSKPFIYHEAHSYKSEYTSLGRVIDYNYQNAVTRIMRGQYNLKEINNFESAFGLAESKSAVVATDDHDSQRTYDYLSYKDPIPHKMGLAFTFANTYGIPKIISSFASNRFEDSPPSDINENIIDPAPEINGKCQMNWNCEHRYYIVRQILQFSKAVQGESVRNFIGNDNGQFGFCRGDKGFIAFNAGAQDMEMEMNVCLPQGTYCDVTSGSYENENNCNKLKGETDECVGTKIVVDENGKALVKIPANDEKKFVAFYRTT